MSIFDYEKRYRNIILDNGMGIRAYILGRVTDKTVMVITDNGMILEINNHEAERGYQCELNEFLMDKLEVFGLSCSMWKKSWANNPVKLDKIQRDWRKVVVEDVYVTKEQAENIINSSIENLNGYKARVGDWATTKYSVRIEIDLPMAENMPLYIAKSKLIGIKKEYIEISEGFVKEAKKIALKNGMLYGRKSDGYESSFKYDLERKTVKHAIYKNVGVIKSRRSIEDAVEEMKNELEWRGKKSGAI